MSAQEPSYAIAWYDNSGQHSVELIDTNGKYYRMSIPDAFKYFPELLGRALVES
jgi:hypothetical protein